MIFNVVNIKNFFLPENNMVNHNSKPWYLGTLLKPNQIKYFLHLPRR